MKWHLRTVWLARVSFVFFAMAQEGFAQPDNYRSLPLTRILNYEGNNSFSDLESQVTLIDFFGTWCAPCIKALPHLSDLKKKFGQDLSILLVSSETEAQLQKFIRSRKDFLFPVLVDENNRWNEFFQPPSLPYTVAIKGGQVIAVTEADNITEALITQWLSSAPPTADTKEIKKQPMALPKKTGNGAVELSQQYLYAARTSNAMTDLISKLRSLSIADLTVMSDDQKKAFWINVYNGYTQASLLADPSLFEKRNTFYKRKNIHVAGEALSLDDIEHGILRRSKSKWSLGYFNKLFPSRREKQLRVDQLDYRLHFALNCGAKSCPPIAFYNDININEQLDLATKVYLGSEVTFDSVKNLVLLPKLMSWFRADFGGKKGMISILKQYSIIPTDKLPSVEYKDYDWTLQLNNYTNEIK